MFLNNVIFSIVVQMLTVTDVRSAAPVVNVNATTNVGVFCGSSVGTDTDATFTVIADEMCITEPLQATVLHSLHRYLILPNSLASPAMGHWGTWPPRLPTVFFSSPEEPHNLRHWTLTLPTQKQYTGL